MVAASSQQGIAIISSVDMISSGQLARAAAALQTQVSRDFAPLWLTGATIAAFTNALDPPKDYWRVYLEEPASGAEDPGSHATNAGQPYASVHYQPNVWSFLLSHEILEMLADPTLGAFKQGPDPQGPGTVQYLVEICDPCGVTPVVGPPGYFIDGFPVSDFVTPAFYDSGTLPGSKFSCRDRVKAPFEEIEDGYISWCDSAGNWFMRTGGVISPASAEGGIEIPGRKPKELVDASSGGVYRKLAPMAVLERLRVLRETEATTRLAFNREIEAEIRSSARVTALGS